MRMALLTGANPRTFEEGPCVRLEQGKWRIQTVNLKDSLLVLSVDNETYPVSTDTVIELQQAATVCVRPTNRGSEPFISVFAEYLDA